MILKSETYHFHRLDLTRQVGFIVTIYDGDGLRLASTQPMPTRSAIPFCHGDPGEIGRSRIPMAVTRLAKTCPKTQCPFRKLDPEVLTV